MLWRPRAPAWDRKPPPAEFIVPSQAILSPRAPSGPGWLHEVKHDGYRLIACKTAAGVRLWTRQAVEYTATFPRIAEAVAHLPVASCTLDGEAVAFGESAYDFHALRSRTGAQSACLIAFDLIQIDGEDLRGRPVEDRRARLEVLLLPNRPDGLLFSAAIEGDGPEVFAHAAGLGLEGIVSKRLGSRYRSGRCTDWVKTKNPTYQRV
jgi:bifunctional non-homologous end joining protein LigD